MDDVLEQKSSILHKTKNTDDMVEHNRQVMLFLEEICCDLCKYRHIVEEGHQPDLVKVHREVQISPEAERFGDIRVYIKNDDQREAYFLEVVYGYNLEKIVGTIAYKYGKDIHIDSLCNKLIILTSKMNSDDIEPLKKDITTVLNPGLSIEIWDETHFIDMINKFFCVHIKNISEKELLTVRTAIDEAKWKFTYGEDNESRQQLPQLMWHFGTWDLRRFYQEYNYRPEEVLKPGMYEHVAILMADLSGFSSYVRNTPDQSISRDSLSKFYSAARYAIHNSGGMLYQFVGDEVVGIFGIPVTDGDYIEHAVDCAEALIEIGKSVSVDWQREIDHSMDASGVHIGIAMGNLNLLRLRPFSTHHIGFFGDSINLTARLMNEAEQNEIVVSNVFHRQLHRSYAKRFSSMAPVKAKNIGDILCWKLGNKAVDG